MPPSSSFPAPARSPKPSARRDFDALLLALAAIALVGELALLLQQMRVISFPLPWERLVVGGEVLGEVVAKTRTLKHRAISSLTWYPMVQGDPIHMDDTLMTGADSTAVVRLKSIGEITLEPFTLLRIGESKVVAGSGPFRLQLAQGTVKVKSRSSQMHVQVRDREIAMKPDTEIVVTTAPLATESEVVVTRGEASLQNEKTADAPLTIAQGEAYRVSAERGLARLETQLKATLISPAPEVRFLASEDSETIRFRWIGESADSVEWSTDPGFTKPVVVPAKGTEAKLDLKPGRYYWRLRRAIAVSSASEFVVMPKPGYRAVEPKPSSTIKTEAKVQIEWAAVPGAKLYRLEISDRLNFSKQLHQIEVEDPKAELADLKPGKYYWRVIAVHDDLGEWPASPAYAFQLKRKMTAPKVKGVKVLPAAKPETKPPDAKPENKTAPNRDGAVHTPWADALASLWDLLVPSAHADPVPKNAPKSKPSEASAGKKQKKAAPAPEPDPSPSWNPSATLWLEFQWERTRGAVAYRLEISANREFTKMISRTKLSDTSAVLELPDVERYYWRVAAIDEDDEQGPFSRVQEMKRERARPKPVKRSIAAEPPTGAKEAAKGTPAGDQAKKDDGPPKKTFRFQFEEARFGYGAAFLLQSLDGPLALSQSGLPLNRFHLAVRFGLMRSELEFGGWLQRLRSVTRNNEIVGLQPDLLTTIGGAEVLWRDLIPAWTLALRARSEADFLRLGSETAGTASKLYAGVGFGKVFHHTSKAMGQGRTELLVDMAPFGPRRGVGLLARSRWAITRAVGEFTPSLEISLYPNYRFGTGSGARELGLDASLTLAIAWEPPPAPVAVPPLAPAPSGITKEKAQPRSTFNSPAPKAERNENQHAQ